jgi:hypothetical protein
MSVVKQKIWVIVQFSENMFYRFGVATPEIATQGVTNVRSQTRIWGNTVVTNKPRRLYNASVYRQANHKHRLAYAGACHAEAEPSRVTSFGYAGE